jgi:hypothetical protein
MDLAAELNLPPGIDLNLLTQVLLLLSVASVVVCYLVARARKADIRKWIILSIVFGPFAVPFVFFASPKNPSSR